MYHAAIFDMDGTLLDSHWVWEHVDLQFQKASGIAVREDYSETVQHMTPTQVAEYTIAEYGLSETPEELKQRWVEIAAELYQTQVKLKPGAKQLLKELTNRGVKIALASSCFSDLCEQALRNNGVYEYFNCLHFSENIGVSKQNADIYLACADDLKTPASKCAVFEDIYKPLAAVKQEGMGYFAVEDVRQSQRMRQKLQKEADCYIKNYYQFIQSNQFMSSFIKKELS